MYIHTINYAALQVNRLVPHATTWMNLSNVTLSERRKEYIEVESII